VFSGERRDFTAEQTNLIEIVAGRVASDLDREVLLQQGVHSQDLRRQLDLVAVAQYDRLPQMPPLLDGWELAGWSLPTDSICGDFYYWSELPDGQLAVAVADAMAHGLEAAVACSNLHAALHAHVCYRHDARQMLARLNETLWTSSAGDQFASLTYLLIDPEAGQLQLSQAGKTALLLSTSPQPLLGSAPPLGTQPEDTYQVTRDRLPRGGVLLLASEGLLPLLERSGRRRSPLSQLLQDAAPTTTAAEIAESVRSLMLAKLGSPPRDATLVVVRREP
jgi:serine phosphatase RsbU (regulator of sigma subunit)